MIEDSKGPLIDICFFDHNDQLLDTQTIEIIPQIKQVWYALINGEVRAFTISGVEIDISQPNVVEILATAKAIELPRTI